MPTATLKYKLPEERVDFRLATKASDMMGALHDIVQFLRDETKYREYETKSESTIAWKFRDDIWNILKEYEIDPYDE